jgi:hypothetical protein
MLIVSIAQYDSVQNPVGPVFFDFGIIEAVLMLCELGQAEPGFAERQLQARPYNQTVFFFPPWPDIFVQDSERDQTSEQAVAVSGRILEGYKSLGFTLVPVPFAPPAERAGFVLATVKSLSSDVWTWPIIGVAVNVEEQIQGYIDSQPEAKRADMQALHELCLNLSPGCKLWFLDGKDDKGKVVSNPNIGYGAYTISYADGSSKEFYRIGLSANTSGISVYVLGLADKTYLSQTFAPTLGKASVTGYCIKFKAVKDINLDVLGAAIRHGFESTD